MEAVLAYLDKVDPEAAERGARERYACFDHFGEDPQAYGYAAGLGLAPSRARTRSSQQLRRAAPHRGRVGREARRPRRRGRRTSTPSRTPGSSRTPSTTTARCSAAASRRWNLRDRHMAETLDALVDAPRAHARRAAEGRRLGAQLAPRRRARHPDGPGGRAERRPARARAPRRATRCCVGFTTYTGTVTAASDWDGPPERKRVRPRAARQLRGALPRRRARPRFLLDLDDHAADALREPRLERAIGVIYRPETERVSATTSTRASPTSSTP